MAQLGYIIDRLSGFIIGPPADKLYPVDPVADEIISPSEGYICVCCPFTAKLIRAILAGSERVITTSLIIGTKSSLIPSSLIYIGMKMASFSIV